MIAVVLHCFAVNDWKPKLIRQITRLHTSELYKEADELHLFVNDVDGDKEELIKEILKDSPKITLNYHLTNHFEFLALNKVDEIARSNENCKIFYFHTKGVWNKFKIMDVEDFYPLKESAVDSWVEVLEYFLIDNWRKCVEKLDEYDTVGVANYGNWWWGNFWWSNAYHIRNITPFKIYLGADRWFAEAWLHVAHPNPNQIKYFTFYNFGYDPHYTILPKYVYDNTDLSNIEFEIISAEYGVFAEQRDEGRAPVVETDTTVDITDIVKNYILEKHNNKNITIEGIESSLIDNFNIIRPVSNILNVVRIKYKTNIDPENEYIITSIFDYLKLF
jgi:hypothetical protein